MELLVNLRNFVDPSALIIAVIGAFLSIASALYLTSRKITAELRFRRFDLTRIYSENVLKSRLETYPQVWEHLSHYAKILHGFPIEGNPIADINSVVKFNYRISEWDSKNALLLSANASMACNYLRVALHQFLGQSANRGGDDLLSKEEKNFIIEHIARMELAIRTDIGVYEVEKLESRRISTNYYTANREIIRDIDALYPRLDQRRQN